LAMEESRVGRNQAAFAALRRQFAKAPSFMDKSLDVLAIVLYNWSLEAVRRNDGNAVCRRLELCLYAKPGYEPAVNIVRQLGCRNITLPPLPAAKKRDANAV